MDVRTRLAAARVTLPLDVAAFAADPPGFLLRRAVAAGPVAPLLLAPRPAYVIAGPEQAHHVLTHSRDFPKGLAHPPGRPEPGPPLALAFGNGLLSSSGDHHARQRRLMQPAFAHGSVAGYAERMLTVATEQTGAWRDGERIELTAALSEVTLRILTSTVFDTPLDEDDVRAIRSAVTAGQHLAGARGLLLAGTRRGMQHLLPQVRAAMAPARAVIDRVVRERATSERRADLLSLLMEAVDPETGTGMSGTDLRDELLTLLLAGHETTTNALSWTFALLALDHSARERLHAEVDDAYTGGPPAADALAGLDWVTACLDEAMRLYPPAWLIARHTDRDTVIAGRAIRAGTSLLVSPFLTHRIPALWPDAESFRPERFAPGGSAYPAGRRPRSAYFPFGGGPRICIGEHFALLEARIVLAVIARQWVLVPEQPGRPAYRPRITLGPKGGLPVTVTRRSR